MNRSSTMRLLRELSCISAFLFVAGCSGHPFLDGPSVDLIDAPNNAVEQDLRVVKTSDIRLAYSAELKKIGAGSFAVAYSDGSHAFRMSAPDQYGDVSEDVIISHSLLRRLRHPYVVGTDEIFVSNKSRKIVSVMELAAQDLEQKIDAQKKKYGKFLNPRPILHQLLQALAYIHDHGLEHLDVKPGNILMMRDGRAALADYDLMSANLPVRLAPREVVSLWYRPVELMYGDPPGEKNRPPFGAADVWALGCVFGEMVTGNPLFEVKDVPELRERIFAFVGTPNKNGWDVSKYPFVSRDERTLWALDDLMGFDERQTPQIDNLEAVFATNTGSSVAFDLFTRMLTLDPAKRITAKDALSHPYFSDLQDQVVDVPPVARVVQGTDLLNACSPVTEEEWWKGRESDLLQPMNSLPSTVIDPYSAFNLGTPEFGTELDDPSITKILDAQLLPLTLRYARRAVAAINSVIERRMERDPLSERDDEWSDALAHQWSTLAKSAHASPVVFPAALLLLDRLAVAIQSAKPDDANALALTSATAVDVSTIAFRVAQKFIDRAPMIDCRFSNVANMDIGKLRELELRFLTVMDFNVSILPNDIAPYIERFSVEAVKTAPLSPSPSIGLWGRWRQFVADFF